MSGSGAEEENGGSLLFWFAGGVVSTMPRGDARGSHYCPVGYSCCTADGPVVVLVVVVVASSTRHPKQSTKTVPTPSDAIAANAVSPLVQPTAKKNGDGDWAV